MVTAQQQRKKNQEMSLTLWWIEFCLRNTIQHRIDNIEPRLHNVFCILSSVAGRSRAID